MSLDDRSEAYRTMFALDELEVLFAELEGKFSSAEIAYGLLLTERSYPNSSISSLIADTRLLLK